MPHAIQCPSALMPVWMVVQHHNRLILQCRTRILIVPEKTPVFGSGYPLGLLQEMPHGMKGHLCQDRGQISLHLIPRSRGQLTVMTGRAISICSAPGVLEIFPVTERTARLGCQHPAIGELVAIYGPWSPEEPVVALVRETNFLQDHRAAVIHSSPEVGR